MNPIRSDVTARLTERAMGAYAVGERDVMKVFPEVAGEETLSATVAQALESLTEVMCLVGAGVLSMEQFLRAIRSALVLASATGYAVGMEVYDERAVALAEIFTGSK